MLHVINLTHEVTSGDKVIFQEHEPIFASFDVDKVEIKLREKEKQVYDKLLVSYDPGDIKGTSFKGDDETSFYIYTKTDSWYGIIQQCPFGSKEDSICQQ